jgi:hypothetical protein
MLFDIPDHVVASLWLVVFVVTVTAIATYSADWDHYTWWYQATFAADAFLGIFGLDVYLVFFFQNTTLIIIASVGLMAWKDCGVFEDTYDSVGAGMYIPGDFGLHYLPGIITLYFALVRAKHVVLDEDQISIQIWTSFSLFLAWATFHGRSCVISVLFLVC